MKGLREKTWGVFECLPSLYSSRRVDCSLSAFNFPLPFSILKSHTSENKKQMEVQAKTERVELFSVFLVEKMSFDFPFVHKEEQNWLHGLRLT